jgi:hypothetical protein
MNAEFFSAISDIEKEKGIPQSYMLEKIEQALLAALKKDSPASQECARVVLDPEKKTVHMFLAKTVADPVTDPGMQISLEQARKMHASAEVGDIINEILSVSPLIQRPELIDIYDDAYTFRIHYQDPEKTLSDKEVENIRRQYLAKLKEKKVTLS